MGHKKKKTHENENIYNEERIRERAKTFMGKIPEAFYDVMAEELIKIFGESAFDPDPVVNTCHCEGSYGWNDAFRAAAAKVGCTEVYKEYRRMDLECSDYIDGEIGDLMAARRY
ncbi:MAG: hypothetical protein IJ794_15440 [Lachnospiraceae bacterium]|nr:hypothetical protein [Lachnospiraceae bacterium]